MNGKAGEQTFVYFVRRNAFQLPFTKHFVRQAILSSQLTLRVKRNEEIPFPRAGRSSPSYSSEISLMEHGWRNA